MSYFDFKPNGKQALERHIFILYYDQQMENYFTNYYIHKTYVKHLNCKLLPTGVFQIHLCNFEGIDYTLSKDDRKASNVVGV
jgi:hypothetical protein